MLFDSHAHLNDDKLINRTEEIVNNAKKLGVHKILCVGYDKNSSFKAVELSEKYKEIHAAIGVHPSEAKGEHIDLSWISDLAKNDKVVAIGEIGLDHYWDKTFAEQQRQLFIDQINIANRINLPIIIHMREATKDTYQVLKEYKSNKISGVMHCYSASKESMQQFLDLGMYISMAGPVTYKNAKTPKEVAMAIPLDRLLIETDSPYLTPMPYRGKINESAYVKYVAQEIAALRDTTVEEIEKHTFENTCRLFNIKD